MKIMFVHFSPLWGLSTGVSRSQSCIICLINMYMHTCIQNSICWHCSKGLNGITGWKAWAWEAQNDMEAADREGLQRVEALGYQPSWQMYLEIWCEICHACSKPAFWKGAHWCGYCPCTCTWIKNLIMIWWWWLLFIIQKVRQNVTGRKKINAKYVLLTMWRQIGHKKLF